jgi:hypothetical protein
MREFLKNRSDYFSHSNLLDEIEDSDELFDKLEEITRYIGSVIIEFNALESTIEYLIAEQMMRSGDQDDRIYVFLSEMMYQGKAKALINLYGQIIEFCDVKITHEDLKVIEKRLEEAARIRNEYAHAHWQEISSSGYVRVKTRPNKKGVSQKYRLFDLEQLEKDMYYVMETPSILGEFDENIMDQLHGRI